MLGVPDVPSIGSSARREELQARTPPAQPYQSNCCDAPMPSGWQMRANYGDGRWATARHHLMEAARPRRAAHIASPEKGGLHVIGPCLVILLHIVIIRC
jgi:hypothetical protein